MWAQVVREGHAVRAAVHAQRDGVRHVGTEVLGAEVDGQVVVHRPGTVVGAEVAHHRVEAARLARVRKREGDGLVRPRAAGAGARARALRRAAPDHAPVTSTASAAKPAIVRFVPFMPVPPVALILPQPQRVRSELF